MTHTRWCGSSRTTVRFSSLLTRLHVAVVTSSDEQTSLQRFCTCAGFSTQQAEALVRTLVRTTRSNMDVVYSDMVTKVHQVRAGP